MFISQSDEVKKMSLSNFTARKLIKDIHKLFNIVFVFHDNVGNRREVFQKIVDQYLKIMEKLR